MKNVRSSPHVILLHLKWTVFVWFWIDRSDLRSQSPDMQWGRRSTSQRASPPTVSLEEPTWVPKDVETRRGLRSRLSNLASAVAFAFGERGSGLSVQ